MGKKIDTSYYRIIGGRSLSGSVSVPGAKNAALPAIVAACLSDESVILENVPLKLNDVKLLIDLLVSVGAKIEKLDHSTLKINGLNINGGILDSHKAGSIRHSLLLLGLCASRRKPLFLPIPGGCNIGNRKHDLHILALERIGYSVKETELGIELNSEWEKPTQNILEIDFHYPTFGGTLNAIFASVLLFGKEVIIRNPAKNPEVLDVIHLLNKMGAKISWDDSQNLRIVGVDKLASASHQIMGDRIIAATMIVAIGATNGTGIVKGSDIQYLRTEIDVWRRAGLTIEQVDNGIFVKGTDEIKAVSIETNAYPAFHTDIQPLHGVLLTKAKGSATIKDIILDGRFKYCYELKKLGAKIEVRDGNFTCVNGAPGQVAFFETTDKLIGSPDLIATDIRGGAAVVIGALLAEGESRVTNIYQIERGYANLPEMLKELGADIERVIKE